MIAPDWIWMDNDANGIGWTPEQREAMAGDVEYVRADIHEAALLEAVRLTGDTCRQAITDEMPEGIATARREAWDAALEKAVGSIRALRSKPEGDA